MATTNNEALPIVVRSIESRVEQLIADHKRLSGLNRELIAQRESLLAAQRQLQERIVVLEKELALTQLNNSLSGSQRGNKRARAYINRLMREVDTCITLLSSSGAK